MERRENRRYPRRLTVKFNRLATRTVHQGFTMNVSFSGLFLSTNVALERGERLRLEISHREREVVIEGQVARLVRVPLQLRQVRPQGVGVRFLSPVELVSELFPTSATIPAATALLPEEEAEAFPEPSPASEAVPDPLPEEPEVLEELEDLEELEEPGNPEEPLPARFEVSLEPGSLVRLTIRALAELRRIVEQDLAYGGIFIPGDEPLPVGTVCTLEVHLPLPEVQPLCTRAEVVHSRPATSPGSGPAGMGLVLDDAAAALHALQSILARF
ncbi:MAG: hypothetical protein GX178_02905 [Acidobacteria bacterium]|nr:PilZ domain-containing protein [Thermoanaerobaculia bacterium]MDI9631187.1 PilZ domain-containing protein [Acidobacteriota bacterium]MBP7812125.1 PilZ domain-containing protein [Thermoanaerobaculia bacterium]MBP8844915.1 PilZ domain-containing protein [Thermoanaerobaculia bacterium]NLN10545.1 hypothetical protein [Acidobacteriota bacterium]